MLDYQLTVSNAAYANDLGIDGDIKIPDCEYEGVLSLIVFPNPTANSISVKIRSTKEPATDLDIVIFDHQFNQVSKYPYSSEGQNIVPVTGLEGGIYYFYVITERGKTLCEKFCVIGH